MKNLQEIATVVQEHVSRYGNDLNYVEFPYVTTLAIAGERSIDHMEKLSVLTETGKRKLDSQLIDKDQELEEVLLKVRKKLRNGKIWKALQIIEEELREEW